MATSLKDQYMRTRCRDFLRAALEQPLLRLLRPNSHSATAASAATAEPKSFELDPAKCGCAEQRALNLRHLQAALADLLAAICAPTALHLFPNELKHLFHLVRLHVHARLQRRSPRDHLHATDG